MSVLHNLISHYDCIAWIPTIRGALSLELIDDANSILGDVDKYSVRFKTYNEFQSQHYIIASSLLTVNDSKAGDDYARSFRYVFTGSINNNDIKEGFLKQYQLTDDHELVKYINHEGLLIGHLTIIAERTHLLSDLEVTLLQKLRNLTKKNDEYNKDFHVKAKSMEDLETTRSKMLLMWKELRVIICKIENDDKNKRETFCFDISLTRDGILLLKDTTAQEYKDYYAAPNTPNDYTNNIPIHRLFKVAMNYVKYLFHTNYHHNEEHDTYLPSSNLHPAMASGNLNLQKVFKHQLDAFLVPIIKLKRSNFKDYSIRPEGVLLYAKAFIEVFETNHLVEQAVTDKARVYCDILLKEVELMNRKQNTLINAALSQHNYFVIVSAFLAFAFTCLKLYSLFFKMHEPMDETIDLNLFLRDIGIVTALLLVAYTLYYISRSRILSKDFIPESNNKGFWLADSSLKYARFSRLYELYIAWNTLKLYARKYRILIPLKLLFSCIMFIATIIIAVIIYIV